MHEIPLRHAPDAPLLVGLLPGGDEHGHDLTHRQTRPIEVLKDGEPNARGIHGQARLTNQRLAGKELLESLYHFRVRRSELEAHQVDEAVLELGFDVEVVFILVGPLHDGKRCVVGELADVEAGEVPEASLPISGAHSPPLPKRGSNSSVTAALMSSCLNTASMFSPKMHSYSCSKSQRPSVRRSSARNASGMRGHWLAGIS